MYNKRINHECLLIVNNKIIIMKCVKLKGKCIIPTRCNTILLYATERLIYQRI